MSSATVGLVRPQPPAMPGGLGVQPEMEPPIQAGKPGMRKRKKKIAMDNGGKPTPIAKPMPVKGGGLMGGAKKKMNKDPMSEMMGIKGPAEKKEDI